jgi:virulence-associated protein VagC
MKLPVSDRGLLIPKELLGKSDEVEVTVQDDRIIITLDKKSSSIRDLGSDPVERDVTDAATRHDRYIYGE